MEQTHAQRTGKQRAENHTIESWNKKTSAHTHEIVTVADLMKVLATMPQHAPIVFDTPTKPDGGCDSFAVRSVYFMPDEWNRGDEDNMVVQFSGFVWDEIYGQV
jgi:hypothetical protein